jgi:hypothetical protein
MRNYIKNEEDAVNRIKKYLGFLFDQGFEIVYKLFDEQVMGNWIVVLQSKECIIRFIQDRGEIRIEIGPPWASTELSPKEHFVYLQTLLGYINNDQSVTRPSFDDLEPDDQLQKLNTLLVSYLDELILFLNRADFAEQETKINAFALAKFKKLFPNAFQA